MPANRAKLAELLAKATGQTLEIRTSTPQTNTATDQQTATGKANLRDALNQPGIKLALEIFPDATVTNIEQQQQPDNDDKDN
ncbi:hypothetical protein [Mucisphaera calidilacus]|uniref:DNA polymerase III subunits gamma and tau n=1 Tax=Mucisphaera calidilacus TaxID=2527982 RepID=A0A518BXX6_9BACT|nr:hypothetical protein [Mucisphaera calidilacus]QDU71837.1 DNA polymerase III subunits gamma and tau [Mucisphaera calidilacus]